MQLGYLGMSAAMLVKHHHFSSLDAAGTFEVGAADSAPATLTGLAGLRAVSLDLRTKCFVSVAAQMLLRKGYANQSVDSHASSSERNQASFSAIFASKPLSVGVYQHGVGTSSGK